MIETGAAVQFLFFSARACTEEYVVKAACGSYAGREIFFRHAPRRRPVSSADILLKYG
jgi:hypothetical protein